MKNVLEKGKFGLAIVFVTFHLYTALFGAIPGNGQRAIHLSIMLAYLGLDLLVKDMDKIIKQIVTAVLLAASVGSILYIYYITPDYDMRGGVMYTHEIVLGAILIVSLIYFAWRKMGPALAIIATFFVSYAFLGPYFPSIMRHGGLKLSRYVHLIAYSSNGIFGSPLNASSTYISLFILLGALFTYTGVGDYFTQLATSLFGGFRGGPAKVAVVASALFGSVSGSSIANVVGTGTFTIPMMKKLGFEPEFAGAVEATASTGGQIMPPIMGTAAFLVAEYIEVPYWSVVKAAIIPALLYFTAVLIAVDLYSLRHNLRGIPKDEMPVLKILLKRLYLILPLVFLMIMIGPLRLSINRGGTYTLIFTLALTSLSKNSRLNKEKTVKLVRSAANGTVSVALATGVCGIIIGTLIGTGLSYRLSTILVKVAGENLMVLLVMAMICGLILGMGMPTASSYLILASLVAPAVVKMGVSKMAAHLFMFYFGIISNVTPPVAMAAYAAAGIAQCDPNRCGWRGFRLAISGFILPYMFTLNPVLLGEGTWYVILYSVATALFGVYCLSCVMEGYFINWPIGIVERVALGAAALLCIDSQPITDLIGLVLFALVFAVGYFFRKRPLRPAA